MKYRILVIGSIIILGTWQFINFDIEHLAKENNPNIQALNNPHIGWHNFLAHTLNILQKIEIAATSGLKATKVKAENLATNSNKIGTTSQKQSSSVNVVSRYESANAPVSGSSSTESHSWIYISENMANDVIRCQLGTNQAANCKVVLSGLFGAEHMTIVNNKFYIVNYNQPIMDHCELAPTGELNSCKELILPINNVAYITYYNNKLLISDLKFANMAECSLDNNFIPYNCTQITALSQNLFTTVKSQNYDYSVVYDANYASSINKCVESSCSVLHDQLITSPTTIEIFNNSAYILDYNTNSLVSCKLQQNGDFYPCNVLKNSFNTPLGLAFYSF